MEAGRWRELRQHFEALLELQESSARDAYLLALDADDLRVDLRRMLARQAQAAELDQPAAKLIAEAIAGGKNEQDWGREQLGKRVGAYQLDSVVGAGGMGMVYRAHRVDGGFVQTVAIKMLLQKSHPGLRARFQKEQSILAGLNHPIIAQMLDGGETEDGLPYLAMEYVDGVPITDYCRDHLPDVAPRLEMLVKVGAALSYAHRNLVIHRDIKPSNILVTSQYGRPKLLDFGIAKLVDEAGMRMLTQQKFGPMTPAYAAPEQFKGGAISVATDIYQFGTLMFRLITGRLPFDGDPDDSLAWGRAVLEREPMTISRALAGVRRGGSEVTRTDAVHSIGRELDRDLDAIVRTAMAKEPQQRYSSMDALIADLEAFLERRPVQARHGGRWYYLSRFINRHRWGVSAGATAIVGLILITTFALLQTQKVRAEAEKVRLSAQFMDAVLKAADPISNSKGGIHTAVDLMDAATASMQKKFADHPELAAPVAMSIANAYANLGAMSRAYPLYVQAIAQLRRAGVPPLALAEALERAAFAAQRNGELRNSEKWLDELDKLLVGKSVEVLRLRDGMLGTRWQIARDAGQTDLALALAEQGLKSLHDQNGALDGELQAAFRRRGTILTDMGRYAEAGRDLQSSLDLAVRSFGTAHSRTLIARQTLAWHYSAAGFPRRGLAELEAVAEPIRQIFGQYSQPFANNWHNRANAHLALGQTDRAINAYRAAADSYRGSASGSSGQVGWALTNVAQILLQQGKIEQARDTFIEVESVWRNSVSANSPVHAHVRFSLAKIELQLDHAHAAQDYINSSVEIYRVHQPHSLDLARALALNAEIAVKLGAKPEAIALYDEALALAQTHASSDVSMAKKWQLARQLLK